MLQPKFNRYPKPTDWNSLLLLAQQAFEDGFRAPTFQELTDKISELVAVRGGSGIVPTVEPETQLPAPATPNMIMIMKGGSYTQPDGTTPLVAPDNSFNVGYWDGDEWKVEISVDIDVDLSRLASQSEVDEISDLVQEKQVGNYFGTLDYRFFNSGDNTSFVTDDPNISQTNESSSDLISLQGQPSGSNKVYFDTGVPVSYESDLTWVLTGKIVSAVTPSNAISLGIGYQNSVGARAFIYQSGTALPSNGIYRIAPRNVNPSEALVGDLPFLYNGASIRIEIDLRGASIVQQVWRWYIDGTLIYSGTLSPFEAQIIPDPSVITSTWQLVIGGNISVVFTKIAKFKSKIVTEEQFKPFKDGVNPFYPFKKDATFISDSPSSAGGTDLNWMKDFLIDIKIFGFNPNDRISLFVVRRQSASTPAESYSFQFYRDTGTGNGAAGARELVMQWIDPSYAEPPSGQLAVIEYDNGIVGFKAYVDWTKVPQPDNGSMTFNAVGFDRQVYINFSVGATPPVEQVGAEVSWHYNDDDAPVTGTELFKQFTLTANVDSDNDTIGCTGASYNTKTEEFVIAYYSFAKESRLWFYNRKDLVDYSPSGTIIPVPTREVDVSAYLYHIQGVAYDRQLDSYWVIGSINPTSNDAERVLVRVDDDGNLLERFEMSAYSFQAGMLAMSPSGENLLIKPNNQSWLLEINKRTKAQVRQVTTATPHEGLGVDYANSKIWIGGNNGNLYRYDYLTMVLEETIPYATLPEGSSMNVEAIIIDPVDQALLIVADAYLHGGHPNGNGMWVFDFAKTIGKQVRFPDMMTWQGNESVIVDFGSSNDLVPATLEKGLGTIQYRGSNTPPTLPAINRTNWRDRPYYGSWGSTTPSAWSDTMTSYRYMQLRVV